MGCLQIKEAMFANCILFATFCSMGTLVRRKKTWRYSARQVMEFDQLMIDILVNVSCKFEMYIFYFAQVFNENVRIAFLYGLSIQYILCKFICAKLRHIAIDTYSVHVNEYTLNSNHSSISLHTLTDHVVTI